MARTLFRRKRGQPSGKRGLAPSRRRIQNCKKALTECGGDEDAATLSLVEGGLRVITGAVAKAEPEKYKLETPVALMGVRGTEFAVVLCDDGTVCQEEGLED